MDPNLRSIKDAICENLRIITNTQGSDNLRAAEEQLSMLETKEDYGLLLMEISLSDELDFGVRHLASTLLHRYILRHWSHNCEEFEEPEIPQQIKHILREFLLKSLAMTSSCPKKKSEHEVKRIVDMFAEAISQIVQVDWHDSWPIVYPVLIEYLSQTVNQSSINATLNVFSELSYKLSDTQEHLSSYGNIILETMLGVFSNSQHFDAFQRASALNNFFGVADQIMFLDRMDKKSYQTYLADHTPKLIDGIVQVLSQPSNFTLEDYHIRSRSLLILNGFINGAKNKLEQYLPNIMEFVWQNLTFCAQKYPQVIGEINDDNDGNDNGNSDIEQEYRNFIYAIIDFVHNVFSSKKCRHVIKPVLGDLLYYIMFFIQIPENSVQQWLADEDTFIMDDDLYDGYSVRLAAVKLFEEISDLMSKPINDNDLIFKRSFLDALNRHLNNAYELQKNNRGEWWKSIEACFFCLGIISDEIVKTVEDSEHSLSGEYKRILENLLLYPDKIQTPFLAGRSCCTASKFSNIMNESSLNNFLNLTVSMLRIREPGVLKILALQATENFFENHLEKLPSNTILKPYLGTFFETLISAAVITSNNDNLEDILKTIEKLLKIDQNFTGSVSGQICSLSVLLHLNCVQINKRDIMELCLSILEKALTIQECQQIVGEQVLFTVLSILKQSQNCKSKNSGTLHVEFKDFNGQNVVKNVQCCPSDVLPNIFKLLSFVLKTCSTTFWNNAILREIFPLCVHCIGSADQEDSLIFVNGTECLRYFVEKCSISLQEYFDPGTNITGIGMAFNICIDLLNPQILQECCANIGKLVVLLIMKGNLQQDKIQMLLRSALVKLNTSTDSNLNRSLIVVFAHLLYFEMQTILVFLNTFPSPDGSTSALEFMMDRWLAAQVGFVGYDNKVTVVALCRLFQHAILGEQNNSGDDNGANINLNRIEVNVSDDHMGSDRIVTRSKAKPSRKVPCTVKILKLLINEYCHLSELNKIQNSGPDSQHFDFDTSESDDEDREEEDRSLDYYDSEEDGDGDFDDVLNDDVAKIVLWDALQQVLRDFRDKCPFGADFMPHLTKEEKKILLDI